METAKKIGIRLFQNIVLAAVMTLASMSSYAQDTTVKRPVGNKSFAEVVSSLESTMPYRFFYREAELDSLRVEVNDSEPVPVLLKRIFQSTNFRFALDEYSVYVVKQSQPIAILPTDFFDRQKPFTLPPKEQQINAVATQRPLRKTTVANENRLFEIGTAGPANRNVVVLTGYVREVENGEPLSNASLTVDSSRTSVLTDAYGYYSLTLPPGRHVIHVESSGKKTASRQVQLRGDGSLDIELTVDVPRLKTVVITSVRQSNVRSTAMGQERLSVQTIKQVPVVFGEADVLRAVLTLPGVTSVGEANTGLNVRGGAANQNLILLNDATVYNPSHLFGFFSAFNPDVVKSVELYKSVVPEKYGGRLSSVLDVMAKQGNAKKLSGVVGVGPLTAKATIEGPLVKDRTSFIAGVRTTYSNWLLKLVPDPSFRNSRASFYDANLHLSHNVDAKNSLYLNGYISRDNFRLNRDTLFRYGNSNLNLKWKRNFSNRLSAVFTAGFDRYQAAIGSEALPTNSYRISFAVGQNYLRSDFIYSLNAKHTLDFGLNSLHYNIQSGERTPVGGQSLVKPEKLQNERALESALYIGDEYNISAGVSIRAGLRLSLFNAIGPREQYAYRDGFSRSKNTVVDTLQIKKGSFFKTYTIPEVRLSTRITLTENTSLKLGFNTTAQYIHTLSNTNTVLPTDVFKLSDQYIQPQRSAQLSAGIYRNFRSNTIETSIEAYFRRAKHYLDVRSGANLVLNNQLETDVVDTRSKAYGIELLMRKSTGKLTGWVGYSYSRIFWQTADLLAPELINNGAYYPANFDKPHSANVNGNFKFSQRFSVSWGGTYSTGRPLTIPVAVFNLGGGQRLLYSERNQFRAPDYFRTDISFLLEGNHKTTKATHNTWSFGVYNLTGRRNVYSIYFTQENGVVKGYELSIFGAPIPFLTYTLRF